MRIAPELASVDLANIRSRYIGSRLPAETAADMEALWLDLDRTRFALAAADERARIAREERDELQKQLYVLRAQLPRLGGPV